MSLPEAIPVAERTTVMSWGYFLGVRRGFHHYARPGADRALCGIEFPERSRRSTGHAACATCDWIARGHPTTDEEWDESRRPPRPVEGDKGQQP